MKKKTGIMIFMLMMALAVSACGSSDNTSTTEAQTEEVQTDESEEEFLDEDEDIEDEEYEEIVVADYDPKEYVKLGDYEGLPVDIRKTEVDESDLEYQIEQTLESYAEEKDKDKAEGEEDYVTATYTLTVDGEELEEYGEEDYDIAIGYADLGSDVDDALIGVKAGDTLDVKTTLDEFYEEYEGKTGIYHLEVSRVYTYETPELTDEFVKENLGYDTVEAYRESLMKDIEEQTEASNRSEAGERALERLVEASTFQGYPQDLYDSIYQQAESYYAYYAELFGAEKEDLISEEDLVESVKQEVYTQIAIKALTEEEKLEITDEEYQAYLEENLEDYGYDTVEDFEEDYSREEIEAEMYREKVINLLLDKADLTELSAEEYAELYEEEMYDEEELDDEEEYDEEEDLLLEEEDDEAGLDDEIEIEEDTEE